MRRLSRYFPALLSLLAGVFAWQRALHRSEEPVVAAQPAVKIPDRTDRPPERETVTLDERIEVHEGSEAHQLILRLPDEASYQQLLAQLPTAEILLLGQLDPLRAVLLFSEDRQAVTHLIKSLGFTGVAPPQAAPELNLRRDGITRTDALAFHGSTIEWLGVTEPNQRWGAGVRIAIIDSGVVAHPDLPSHFESLNVIPDLDETEPTHPHGTAVASVIFGQGKHVTGLAPAAELVSIRTTRTEGKSDAYLVAAALLKAIEAKVDLINLSIGSLVSSSLQRDAVKMAQEAGIVIIASAGNESSDHLRYPAAYPGVISVGAVDAGGERMAFSNSGVTLTLTAPGVAMLTAMPGNRYGLTSGTSVSAPLVTAAIAATMSDGSGRHLTAQEAAAIVLAHTDDIGPPGHDPEYGNGILNLNRIMHRDQVGIVDACLTDQRLQAQPDGSWALQVTVQNRGTTILANSMIRLEQPAALASVGLLQPGEIHSVQFPVQAPAEPGAAIEFTTRLQLTNSAPDISPEDHVLTSQLRFP